MMVTTTMMTGGATKMPDGVRNEFKASLKRAEVGFGPLGVAASPPVGIGIVQGWGGLECQQRGWTIIAILRGEKSKRA